MDDPPPPAYSAYGQAGAVTNMPAQPTAAPPAVGPAAGSGAQPNSSGSYPAVLPASVNAAGGYPSAAAGGAYPKAGRQDRTMSATYVGSSASTPNPNEVKLYSSVKERRSFDDLANFYSIIKALDVLECAFIKDAVTNEQYSQECTKLLKQHQTLERTLQGEGIVKDTHAFMMTFKQLHCPHALNRINDGKPATHEMQSGKGDQSLAAFEAASQVITAKDEVGMDVTTRVGDIHHLIIDIVDTLSQISYNGDGKGKMMEWSARLNSRKAADILSDDDKEQMDFDLQLTYDELHKWLKKQNRQSS